MATQPLVEPQDDTADGGAMSDEELAAILSEHETRAIGYYESEIASEQADALDRYYRRPYGDERPGRSQVVDGTVAITVDNALAAVLKPFASSDETVVFNPTGPEDEEVAEQATEYVNYVLHNDNGGFLILHDWFKDALLQKVGVVKAYWEDYSRPVVERLENLTAIDIQSLGQDQETKVIGGPYEPDEYGLYAVDVERVHTDGKLCIENIPPEEYRISPFARPWRTPPYEAHVTRKSRSELIEMGFDKSVVMSLSKADNNGLADSRAQSRYQDEDWGAGREDTVGPEASAMVDFNDEFVLVDYDGDGISELRRVMRSGKVIFHNEQVDYSLFARLCPAPMPHKIYGLSLADQVKDEQKISTVLWRQTLDNLYLSNNPRPVIGEQGERDDGSTINDFLDDAPGALIRAKDASQIDNFAVAFVADKAFPMLAYVEKQAQSRTGISKEGQGLDPDALDASGQKTAAQTAVEEEGRNSRAEMIARIFAETGVRDLFRLMLKLLVNHQPRARMIRLRKKWVEMDPRAWNADMDVSISVGLGIGSKAQQMVTAQTVLQTMEALGQTPFADLINRENVYNGVKRLFNAAGIKNVDDFISEPQRDEQGNVVNPPPQPDPKMAEVQGKLQMEQMKHQQDSQIKAAELEQSSQEGALKLQLMREEAAAKLQLEQQKAAAEAAMNEQRLQMEMGLKEREMQMRERISERDAERRDTESKAKLSANREGGDLDK